MGGHLGTPPLGIAGFGLKWANYFRGNNLGSPMTLPAGVQGAVTVAVQGAVEAALQIAVTVAVAGVGITQYA